MNNVINCVHDNKDAYDFQKKLYDDLMKLVPKYESFSYKDHVCNDGTIYRMFGYRILSESYEIFLEENAVNCRGATFKLDSDGDFCELVSLPFEKFFNLNENPITTNLDLSTVVEITNKVDGSMVSSYIHNGEVKLKTKMGITSPQALAAMEFIRKPENRDLYDDIYHLELEGYTTILEWTSPSNIGVLIYTEDKLITIGVRSRVDGTYLYKNDISDMGYRVLYNLWVDTINVDNVTDFISSLRQEKFIEGVVLRLSNGIRVKCKTEWYVGLHVIKNNIRVLRKLISVVMDDGVDDIKALLYTDKDAVDYLNYVSSEVNRIINGFCSYVEEFHSKYKHLTNKEYYSKIKDPEYTYVLMRKYRSLDTDIKAYMYRKREYFFKDIMDFDKYIINNKIV